MMRDKLQFDEIGYWSEIKLDIVREYAEAYSKIFSAKKQEEFYHIYIDAFAGSGLNLSKQSGELVPGSPLNALWIQHPFREYHFIDIDCAKAKQLRNLCQDYTPVRVYEGDCNIILKRILPTVHYKEHKRALCILDPYGIHLKWDVIESAGKMRTVDIFVNLPILDINRNVIWRNPERVSEANLHRMNDFWGDESWRDIAYKKVEGLFGNMVGKENNQAIAEAYRDRLKTVAQFAYVPEPLPMRNSKRSVVYYLFFASQKPVAEKIISDIFSKYKSGMA